MSAASKNKDHLLRLMAYADGELEGAERDEVERLLLTDVDGARFANDLATLGEVVKVGHGASSEAKAVASFDITDALMAKIEQAAPVAARNAEVIQLDAARARRRKIGTYVAVALTLAASVFFVMRGKNEQPLAQAPLAPVPAPALIASASTNGAGVDVDLVQTPGRSVSVFYVPSETSLTTSVVVWVDETGEK